MGKVQLLDERGESIPRFRSQGSEGKTMVTWAGLAPGGYMLTRRGVPSDSRVLRHPINLSAGATVELDSSELAFEDWRRLEIVAGDGVIAADRLRFESIVDSEGPGTTVLDTLKLEERCLATSVLLPPKWFGPGRSIRCTLLVGGVGAVEIQRLRPGDLLEPVRIGSLRPDLRDESIQGFQRYRADGRRSRWRRLGLRSGDGSVRLPAGTWAIELLGPGGERTARVEVVPGETVGL